MSAQLNCPSCRSPVTVPADFADTTIRCGICWTEVPVPKAENAPVLKPVSQPAVPTAKPLPANGSGAAKPSGVRVAAALPDGAKPAAGMARLEALIHKAGTRLREAAPVVPAKPVTAVRVVVAPPAAPVKAAPAAVVAEPAVEIIEPEIVAEVPVIRPTPAADPPVITPSTARPRTGRRVDDEPKRKPRFKNRDDRDDDDDDRHPPRRATKKGTLVLAVSAGVAALFLFAVGAFFAIKYAVSTDPDDPANGNEPGAGNNFNPQANANPLPAFRVPDPLPAAPLPNNVPPADNNPAPFNPPQFNPPPFNPLPPKPAKEFVWKTFSADGFSADFPDEVQTDPRHWLHVHGTGAAARAGFVKADGKKFTVRGAGYLFEASYVDLPAQFEPDYKRVLTPFEQQNVVACKFAGLQGYEFVKTGFGTDVKKVVQVGRRMFVFYAQTNIAFAFDRDEKKAEEARKKFFDTVRFGDGPAGADGPGVQQNPGGDPQAFGRALTAIARVDPFWAAVVLPEKNEVLVFSLRVNAAGKPAGVVRRYSYPGFKPKNTYHLPYPVTAAVADEKAGKLVVTVSTKPEIAQKDTERLVHVGDVQVYDLKPLFDGTAGERDELKPAATVAFGGRLAGLELVGGKAVVLSNHATSNKVKPWRTKLTQIDPVTGRTTGTELDLPDPAWRLRASADGRRLYVTEAQLSPPPTGLPIWGAARNGYVLVVDVKNWKREKTYSLPGLAFDLAVTEDSTLLAAVSQGRDVKLYAIPDGGQTVDLNPAAGPNVVSGYAALTPDGKRLVTSPPREFGVAVYDVTNLDGPGGLKKATETKFVKAPGGGDAATPIGGHFVITPDGKYALFQLGMVVELGKPAVN
jgi:hypothetical protein